jgi:hypothetical protein
MRRSTARRSYVYTPEPAETPEPSPVTCECPSINVGDYYKAKLVQIHTRACAGIPSTPLELVPALEPCDVCGGPAPCASCADWACPPVGTAIVCTLRADQAKPAKTFKGIVTRIDAAEPEDSEGNGGWPAGVVVNYPKMKWKKNLGVSIFHAWPSTFCEAVSS